LAVLKYPLDIGRLKKLENIPQTSSWHKSVVLNKSLNLNLDGKSLMAGEAGNK